MTHYVYFSERVFRLLCLFEIIKIEAALCYGCLYNSFIDQERVPKELTTIHVENDMDLADDLR